MSFNSNYNQPCFIMKGLTPQNIPYYINQLRNQGLLDLGYPQTPSYMKYSKQPMPYQLCNRPNLYSSIYHQHQLSPSASFQKMLFQRISSNSVFQTSRHQNIKKTKKEEIIIISDDDQPIEEKLNQKKQKPVIALKQFQLQNKQTTQKISSNLSIQKQKKINKFNKINKIIKKKQKKLSNKDNNKVKQIKIIKQLKKQKQNHQKQLKILIKSQRQSIRKKKNKIKTYKNVTLQISQPVHYQDSTCKIRNGKQYQSNIPQCITNPAQRLIWINNKKQNLLTRLISLHF